MPLLGLQLNIFSIMAFPRIIGIGIDSGIHLVHRFRDEPGAPRDDPGALADGVMHTGKAILEENHDSVSLAWRLRCGVGAVAVAEARWRASESADGRGDEPTV